MATTGAKQNAWPDRAGSVASALCAVHCLLLAVAPAALPALGLVSLANEAFEWAFFALAVSLAVLAALMGYPVHRDRGVLLGFGVGIALLLAGRLGEEMQLGSWSVALAVVGGLVVFVSHLASARSQRR